MELRECVDFSREGVASALSALAARGVGAEAVVLSTCNRVEIYGALPRGSSASPVGGLALCLESHCVATAPVHAACARTPNSMSR